MVLAGAAADLDPLGDGLVEAGTLEEDEASRLALEVTTLAVSGRLEPFSREMARVGRATADGPRRTGSKEDADGQG